MKPAFFASAFTPLQEISHKEAAEWRLVFRAWEANPGSAGMSHWPLLQSIENLDGFEFTAFLSWTFVLFLGIGFAADYVLTSRGVGPYWNAAFALAGGYLGLCLHDWRLVSFPAYEPELTVYMVLTGLMTALLGANAIAMRR